MTRLFCLWCWVCAAALSAEWPPRLDSNGTDLRTLDGRAIEHYIHGARAEWGYPNNAPDQWSDPAARESGKTGQNHNSFYVVGPLRQRRNAPLCVVLHSANRTAFDYLAYQFLNRKIDSNDDPATVVTRVPDDCYALYPNSINDEWWGWTMARQDPAKYSAALTPPEKRVLDTIEWVVERYKIDRNRIYLSGVSMGGCGALGIGLPHGDIFAAMLVDVPAGTEYVAFRRGFPGMPGSGDTWLKQVSGYGLPDPPPMVDFSAQNDNWSKTQPALMSAALSGRLPIVLGWGPFGHTTFTKAISKYPLSALALEFPWFEIRKNAAYPVFTRATSDQRSPWRGESGEFDESGQMNAYFRWTGQQDTPSKFEMKLWIAHPNGQGPDQSTADVTLRRLQRFKTEPGKSYDWRLVREGKLGASGRVVADAANLLTFPGVILTGVPSELVVRSFKE